MHRIPSFERAAVNQDSPAPKSCESGAFSNLSRRRFFSTAAKNTDFDEFFGTLSSEEADRFDAALREMRQVDPADWKLPD